MSYAWRPPYLTDFQICHGGGQQSTQQQTQQVQLPAWVNQAAESNYSNAQDIAARPYQANPNATIAPMTADQTQAYSTIRNMQGATAPAYTAAEGAAGNLLGGAAPITTGQLTTDAQSLMNPYVTSVVDPTVTQMRQGLNQTLGQTRANASNVGAFGGSRLGVQEGVAQSQEALGEGQLVGGLLSSGYDKALAAAQDLGKTNLSAGEWATSMLPQLASASSDQTAKEAALLEGSGRAQQGQSQAVSDLAASQWQDEWNYPIQMQQLLQSALGMSPYGSTTNTTGTSTAPSNVAGQVMGGIGTAASIAGTAAIVI